MLYCARMIGTSTEEVAIPEPRRPARYFSPGFTVFCTVVVLVLMSLYAAPWRGSPLDQLERPAESLERLVTRDLDVRDALRSAPRSEPVCIGLSSPSTTGIPASRNRGAG